jgi:hypothetical protein
MCGNNKESDVFSHRGRTLKENCDIATKLRRENTY